MVKIIVIRVFPPLFYHYSAEKTTISVFKMTLCIKAFIDMEDKCSLNLDKYYL